jgi:hypothetical protein
MISFTRLGKAQGLGNQMFQYAFLRTTAQRLGVTFFCPAWKGERIFQLKDEAVRVREPLSIDKKYCQPKDTSGFSPSALRIEDGTEIFGFFQSEKYFDFCVDDIKSEFSFDLNFKNSCQSFINKHNENKKRIKNSYMDIAD